MIPSARPSPSPCPPSLPSPLPPHNKQFSPKVDIPSCYRTAEQRGSPRPTDWCWQVPTSYTKIYVPKGAKKCYGASSLVQKRQKLLAAHASTGRRTSRFGSRFFCPDPAFPYATTNTEFIPAKICFRHQSDVKGVRATEKFSSWCYQVSTQFVKKHKKKAWRCGAPRYVVVFPPVHSEGSSRSAASCPCSHE